MFSFMKLDQIADPVWVNLCLASQIAPGKALAVEAEGYRLLLCSTPSGLVAIENRCSHQALPLDRARIMGDQIICPHHGARFDLKTGCPLAGAAVHPLRRFPVSVENGQVSVQLPGAKG